MFSRAQQQDCGKVGDLHQFYGSPLLHHGTGILKMGSKHSYPQTLWELTAAEKKQKKSMKTSKLEGKRGSEKAVITLQTQRHNDYLCLRHCLNSKQYLCYPTLLTNVNNQQNTAGPIMRKDTGLSSSTGRYHLIPRLKQTLTIFINTPSWVQVISRQMYKQLIATVSPSTIQFLTRVM